MTIPQFADLVERMRAAQKEYFKNRDKNVLQESKALEKKVDEAIKEMKSKSEETLQNSVDFLTEDEVIILARK